jgi:hypothetical protein
VSWPKTVLFAILPLKVSVVYLVSGGQQNHFINPDVPLMPRKSVGKKAADKREISAKIRQ